MALQEGFFYRTYAMYPHEVSEESPCQSMAALIDSPEHGEPIHITEYMTIWSIPICTTENTTMWSIPGVKVEKPHLCYLARFDPATSIGVIFLGTRSPSYPHRFVPVHGGTQQDTSTMLTTDPPAAFTEIFYLNLSYPLRVKLVYVPPPTSLNSLRRSRFGLSTAVRPPPVGITEYQTVVPRLLVSLDAISVDTFWQLHKAYHIARPTRRTSLGLDGGATAGGGSGETSGGDGGSMPHKGGKRGALDKGGRGAAPDGGGGVVSGSGSSDAPWGRIGKLRIGIDICCILNDASDDESESDANAECVEFGEDALVLDGTVVVSDFSFDTGIGSPEGTQSDVHLVQTVSQGRIISDDEYLNSNNWNGHH